MAQASAFCIFETAIGPVGLAWNGKGVAGAQLPGVDEEGTRRRLQRSHPGAIETAPTPEMQRVIQRLQALLAGEHDDLANVPLDWEGTPEFNRRVYEVTRAIPPGRVMTYGEVAAAIGDPGAARAVGQALGANPYAPIVPCHRVLGAGNTGTGFSATGGVDTKLKMLEIEKTRFGKDPGLFD